MRLIKPYQLTHWAGSDAAKPRFPYLVKSLICAVIEPTKLRMPSDDAVWLPGADGEVLCKEDNRFVPHGWSLWECGTEARIKGKADKDYEKRSQKNSEEGKTATCPDRSQVTFVFVTPRKWPGKGKWVAERKKEHIWKDVVAFDAVELVDWLEYAPAVSLWFGYEARYSPEKGLKSSDQAWKYWKNLTDPPASERLVVAGRMEQEKEIIRSA